MDVLSHRLCTTRLGTLLKAPCQTWLHMKLVSANNLRLSHSPAMEQLHLALHFVEVQPLLCSLFRCLCKGAFYYLHSYVDQQDVYEYLTLASSLFFFRKIYQSCGHADEPRLRSVLRL